MSIPIIARLLILTASLAFAGCTSPPANKSGEESAASDATKKEEAPEFQSGRAAFQKLYVAARNWAVDSRPIQMTSRPQKGDKQDGTASVWHAMFASPSKQSSRSFTWSGAVGENAPERGVTPGSIGTFTASNISTRPFDPLFLKIDTQKALEVANKRGGAPILKRNAEQPVAYQLNWDAQQSRLTWKVIYGESERNYQLAVVVNASTGAYVRTEK